MENIQQVTVHTLKRSVFLILALSVMLSGCNLFNLGGQPATDETPAAEAATPAIPTPATLAPTLDTALSTPTATPTGASGDLAPTPIPPPTEIAPPTVEGEEGGTPAPATPDISGPGISINPALGEPGEVVHVDGDGFGPYAAVTLHWCAPDGPTGPVYWDEMADENGSFEVDLIVPPAAQWPGGAPKEGDMLQLRAKSEKLGDYYYWANFTYVKRFIPAETLVQTYTNTDYGYAIDLPNAWTWSWEEDDTSDVRFLSPSAKGRGFIRVVNTSDMGAAVSAVMAAEATGQSYTTEQKQLGAHTGVEAKAGNGLIVWFISHGGRIYALSFTKDNGEFHAIIASSFRFT